MVRCSVTASRSTTCVATHQQRVRVLCFFKSKDVAKKNRENLKLSDEKPVVSSKRTTKFVPFVRLSGRFSCLNSKSAAKIRF